MKLEEGKGNIILISKAAMVRRVLGLIREGHASERPWGVSQATWLAVAERMGIKERKPLTKGKA